MAAKKATRTIPIVFVGVIDPVRTGIVVSLARPGGNVTGFTQGELAAKRLELLRAAVPSLSHIAIPAGSVFTEPARQPHFFWAKDR